MNKKLVKAISTILTMLMLTSAISIVVSAAGNSISAATPMTLGSSYSGSVGDNDEKEFYKFTLSESGRVTVNLTADVFVLAFYLYDESQNIVWKNTWSVWDSATEINSLNRIFYLTGGTYYFAIIREKGAGNYNIKTSFSSSGESFVETQGGTNENIKTATPISLNKEYKGYLAINEKKDFYKITISESQKIKINFNGNIKALAYYFYDASGNLIWENTWSIWNDSETNILEKEFDLSAGTYYFGVENPSNAIDQRFCGDYTFNISAPDAENSSDPSDPATPENPGDSGSSSDDEPFIITFFVGIWEFLVNVFMFFFGFLF